MSEERVCSKCGGSGPFPPQGKRCKACVAKRKAAWYQRKKDVIASQQKRYRQEKPVLYDPVKGVEKVLRLASKNILSKPAPLPSVHMKSVEIQAKLMSGGHLDEISSMPAHV